jgi:hypothetical protein
MKIRPAEAQLFHADGRTDRHEEGTSHFSPFFKTRHKTDSVLHMTRQ